MASADPVTEFLSAAERAEHSRVDTTPAALATAGEGCRPSVRMVLVRHVDQRGFVFYTNYRSRKGRELAANPYAALCFHWSTLDEQIRVEGRIEVLAGPESDRYFAGRPRGSQLGAWASDQSQPLGTREVLEDRYRAVEREFTGREVPRPSFWGGYLLVPDRVEFWYGRPDRLHDRIIYSRQAGGWSIGRLYP